MTLPDKHLLTLGWIISLYAILMYVSYIDQSHLNLSEKKDSLILPLAIVINCTLWIGYYYLRDKMYLLIIVANVLGVVLSVICFATAL